MQLIIIPILYTIIFFKTIPMDCDLTHAFRTFNHLFCLVHFFFILNCSECLVLSQKVQLTIFERKYDVKNIEYIFTFQ